MTVALVAGVIVRTLVRPKQPVKFYNVGRSGAGTNAGPSQTTSSIFPPLFMRGLAQTLVRPKQQVPLFTLYPFGAWHKAGAAPNNKFHYSLFFSYGLPTPPVHA